MLSRDGTDPKVSRAFYIAVTQVVLLFGSEKWVLTSQMEKALDSFQSWVARKITGRQPRRSKDRSWIYPLLVGIIKETEMVVIRTSIIQRQNTVAQFIATRPILDLCEQAAQRSGVQVSWRWWEQTGIDLRGAHMKLTPRWIISYILSLVASSTRLRELPKLMRPSIQTTGKDGSN